MQEVIRVRNVTKKYQQKAAVDNVSFSIQKGEIVAILGANGAGKTTTIMMLLGLLKPTTGEIKLFQQRPQEKATREKLGTMLQEVSVISGLTVCEILELIRNYYPQPIPLSNLIHLTGLTEQDLKSRAEKLSGGQKRRLSFALALAGNPELIIFDEPTVGMDTSARSHFWHTVQNLSEQGKTILFSTHYLQEADDVAKRILLFHNGKVVADGTPLQIKSRITKQAISFLVNDELLLEKLYMHKETERIYQKGGRIFLEGPNTDRLLTLIFEEKIGAFDIQIEHGKLEEAFAQLTNGNMEAV